MKNFKKSKTKTSKAKITKAKTSKTKTSKTKTPGYFSKLCFRLFRNTCSLERNCLMTASKNPENINVQLLNLAIVLSTSSAMAESLNHC